MMSTQARKLVRTGYFAGITRVSVTVPAGKPSKIWIRKKKHASPLRKTVRPMDTVAYQTPGSNRSWCFSGGVHADMETVSSII